MPVSYTHLDVYKRQVLIRRLLLNCPRCLLRWPLHSSSLEVEAILFYDVLIQRLSSSKAECRMILLSSFINSRLFFNVELDYTGIYSLQNKSFVFF